MNKVFILLSALLFFPAVFFGIDITTLDGTVYKNAKVVNTMPDGILISFVGDNDFDTVKLVKFKDLPVTVQKKYGYNKKNADTFDKEHQKWLDEQQKLAVKRKKAAEQQAKLQRLEIEDGYKDLKKNSADTVLDQVKKNTDNTQKNELNKLLNTLEKVPVQADENNVQNSDNAGETGIIGNLLNKVIQNSSNPDN